MSEDSAQHHQTSAERKRSHLHHVVEQGVRLDQRVHHAGLRRNKRKTRISVRTALQPVVPGRSPSHRCPLSDSPAPPARTLLLTQSPPKAGPSHRVPSHRPPQENPLPSLRVPAAQPPGSPPVWALCRGSRRGPRTPGCTRRPRAAPPPSGPPHRAGPPGLTAAGHAGSCSPRAEHAGKCCSRAGHAGKRSAPISAR